MIKKFTFPVCCKCLSNRTIEILRDAVYIKKCKCGESGILLFSKIEMSITSPEKTNIENKTERWSPKFGQCDKVESRTLTKEITDEQDET